MLSNAINNDLLRLTVANWTTNLNQSSSITVLFTETNTSVALDSNLTQNIDLTQYWLPYEPTTKFLFNYSHVFMIINNNTSTDTTD